MARPDSNEALAVTFVRSSERRQPGTQLQEWWSDATGRVFEVRELNSYSSSDDLETGAKGYLAFIAGAPRVLEHPNDSVDAVRDPPEFSHEQAGSAVDTGRRGPNIWLWVFLGALVVVALATLL